jgi:diguanylate cyclase (GGDEF)-like protein
LVPDIFMSAASFLLAINLLFAGLFATAFGIVAVYYRSAGAKWMSIAYATGMGYVLLEFALPFQVNATPVVYLIFATFLIVLAFSTIALARHYQTRPPLLALAAVIALSLFVNLFTIESPRDWLLGGLVYQGPYTLMQLTTIWVVANARKHRALDKTLIAMLGISALHFLMKPFLAAFLGSGPSPQSYINTLYAAVSQSTGAVIMTSVGLLILLIIVRDMMAEVTERSETDTLSGLLNRRGFDEQAEKGRAMAARASAPAVVIVADLDHFKRVNDTYGHDAGDAAIAAFAAVLRKSFDMRAIIGRRGGEEFAVMWPGADLRAARGAAAQVRQALANMSAAERGTPEPITASFGIAAMHAGDSLSYMMRRADGALYDAKARGRDRASIAAAPAAAIERGGAPA